MKKVEFLELPNAGNGFYVLLGVFGFMIALALAGALYMEHNGHYVTGMSNQIVWGMPHVFAVFLIVAASGALNVASIASVFNKPAYKPLAPLSALLALCLLAGGLTVLLLDLGRPDRLIVAMTYYNFKSIFAWNIILYTGFFAIVGVYLVTMLHFSAKRFSKPVGIIAFLWRLTLTTGTGSIFGFLVAREAYDAAVMAPMFIVMSFSFGLAIFILVLISSFKGAGRPLGDTLLFRLKNLLGVFIAGVLYFVIAYHLTNLYATQHHGVEAFVLLNGGIYTQLFWIGQILLGSLLPLFLLYHPSLGRSRNAIVMACVLTIGGGLAQLYIIIIGGQAYPMTLFPGKEVSSSFFDSGISYYLPSLPEIVLGLGGVAVSLALLLVAIKVLRILPISLADADAPDAHDSTPSRTTPADQLGVQT